MQNQQPISHHKIVILLVFICAAIMTSVFVFHLSHNQPVQKILTADEGTLFPIGRDIKSFALLDNHNQAFTQKNFLNHWTLLFFGFTHCSNVCPTTLDMMGRAYSQLQKQYPSLQVVLVSLDPERD